MHVLYLTDRLSTRGGAGHHLLDVIGAVEAIGHRTSVASGGVAQDVPDWIARRARILRGLGAASSSCNRLDGLDELLENADVIHVQNVMNPFAIRQAVTTGRAVITVQDHRVFCPGPGRTLPDRNRCNQPMSSPVCTVCLPQQEYRERMLHRTAERRDALVGARLVVLSRYMRHELAAAGLPDATVIPPWVTIDPQPSAAGDSFLLAGRLVWHKAPEDAWEAWRSAGEPLPLRIAGGGPLTDRLRGCEQLGWLDRDTLRARLREARALLFPARWQEPFGIVGVEALAVGTPVIVAAEGGTEDWNDAGCLVVKPGDCHGMAAAIRSLADDPATAAALGAQGQAAVRRKFVKEELLSSLVTVYERAAG